MQEDVTAIIVGHALKSAASRAGVLTKASLDMQSLSMVLGQVLPQRLHVALRYIHYPLSYDMVTPLRPMCLLLHYMKPLGS